MTNFNPEITIPRKASQISATVLPDGRWLLHDPVANAVITLNAPAGIFWELCDGLTPLSDIITQLKELYPDASYDTLHEESQGTLTILLEQGLIEIDQSDEK